MYIYRKSVLLTIPYGHWPLDVNCVIVLLCYCDKLYIYIYVEAKRKCCVLFRSVRNTFEYTCVHI